VRALRGRLTGKTPAPLSESAAPLHARQQQSEAVLRQYAVFRQSRDQAAERPERRRGGAGGAAAPSTPGARF